MRRLPILITDRRARPRFLVVAVDLLRSFAPRHTDSV
jgi:hypothetical protein